MDLKKGLDRMRTSENIILSSISIESGEHDGFFSNTKGQVTVFIIIGILILAVTAGILYVTQKTVREPLEIESEQILSTIPQEFQPIQLYTENCLRDIGKKGLLLLGEQGGYIYPDLVGKYSETEPTEGDGINLQQKSVPYWHYNSQPNVANKVVYASLRPELHESEEGDFSIEGQLARFTEEKLNDCLQNYGSFAEQGFMVTEEGSRDVTVRVGEETVNFRLEMLLTASRGESTADLQTFVVKIPLHLKKYYETALQIQQVQQNYSFLERQALDLIATYGDVDAAKLPPTDALTFDFIPPVTWTEVGVKENLKNALISRVPLLRYLGSENFYRYEYPSSAGVTISLRDLYQKNYDNTILPLELGNDVEISFDYFGWEPYFDANDKGGKIEASSLSADYFKLHFKANHYYTTYDLSYPVLVTLHDPTALGNEGYNFVLALEANIRNNEIVSSGDMQPAPVAAISSMVCDEEKKNTELVKTIVIDSYTQEPLSDVQIGFSIPTQDDCIMGNTNDDGEFESSYPAVYGGVGSFIKKEYLTSFYPIDTYNFKKQPGIIGYAVAGYPDKVVEMHKIKSVNVTIKKKVLRKCIAFEEGEECFGQGLLSGGNPVYSFTPTMRNEEHRWVYVNAPQPLRETETATMVLTRVGDVNPLIQGDDVVVPITLQGDKKMTVELVPGVYKVDGLLTTEEGIVIPEEERCEDDECFTFDTQVWDKFLIGQVLWDTSATYLVIRPEQLYSSSNIVFYILAFDEYSVPALEHYRVIEDVQVLGQLGNISKQLRIGFEPRFS